MSNVLSKNQALEQGFDLRGYSFRKEDIPVGEYVASLDFKVWADKVMAVTCYFTKEEGGQKFMLTVFRTHDTKEYTLDGIDFKTCPNTRYRITVDINSKGNIKFSKVKAG